MESYIGKETTLRDYLRVLFTRKAIIITAVVVVMATVILKQELKTPIYMATVKMLIAGNKRGSEYIYKKVFFAQGVLSSYTGLVESKTVLERAVNSLGLHQRPLDYEKQFSSKLKAILIDHRVKKLNRTLEKMTPDEKQKLLFNMAMQSLEQRVFVSISEDEHIFNMYVSDFTPDMAVLIANVVSRSYVIFDLEQQAAELQLKFGEKHTTVVLLEKYIKELKETLDGRLLPDIEAMGPASVKIIEQARTASPVIRARQFLLIISFFMSLFFGVVLVFMFDYLDQTFKSPQDVEKFLDIPVLGSVPERKRKDKLLISDANPKTTAYIRSFQKLSSRIYLLIKEKKSKSLLITDVEGSEDTAAVLANLGIYLAHKANHKVLIIDANLKSPSLSKVLNISGNQGLTDVLAEKISLQDAIKDLGSNLHVLPVGKSQSAPVALLESSMISDIIKTAGEKYDIIFLACADLKNFTDAVTISSFADGIILVVNEGKTNRQAVRWAIAPLEQKKADITGVILNNRKYVIPEIIYKLT